MAKIKIEKPNPEKLKALQIDSWSPWQSEPCTFDWEYDCVETAYVFEGHVTVKTPEETVEIKSGDLVTFPKGLKCNWTVHKTIRKVYSFEE